MLGFGFPGGEGLDQATVRAIRAGVRPRPGEARHLGPGPLGRPSLMPDSIGGVDQVRPVVTGHAVEEDRPPGRVGEQVGRLDELVERGRRASHGDDDPVHPRLADDPILLDVLRVVPIDGRERDDRADLLPPDDTSQGARPLPGTSDHPTGDDDGDPLLEQVVPVGRQDDARQRSGGNRQAEHVTSAGTFQTWIPSNTDRPARKPARAETGRIVARQGLPATPNARPRRARRTALWPHFGGLAGVVLESSEAFLTAEPSSFGASAEAFLAAIASSLPGWIPFLASAIVWFAWQRAVSLGSM